MLRDYIPALTICCLIIVNAVLVLTGCVRREGTEAPEYELEGEVSMFVSDRPDIPFVTDSVITVMDGRGTPNSYIMQVTAMEYPAPVDTFKFTVFGIDLRDTVYIDSSTYGGIAGYSRSGSEVFLSNLPGGEGRVVLKRFNPASGRVAGWFSFILVEAITGEQIQIFDGFFDTQIDSTAL